MKYKFVPDIYDIEILERKNINYDEILNLQVKYRHAFETLLKKHLNFKQLDMILNKTEIKIPVIQDLEYNFYHKFSSLESEYFFLRNNIHIGNLSDEEIQKLKTMLLDNATIDEQFILSTFQKVLFENVDATFYGTPTDSNLASGKAIIFELAYSERKCSLEQSQKISNIYQKLKQAIENVLYPYLNCPINFVVNDGYEKIYSDMENNTQDIEMATKFI